MMDISVFIKTEKLLSQYDGNEVIMRINQPKGSYFPKVKEIVELISCPTNDAIPIM